ncbi:MAG: hypothetical protein ACLFU8_01295 [Anaerolineales bacterium]
MRRWWEERGEPALRAYLPSDFWVPLPLSFWIALVLFVGGLLALYGGHAVVRRIQLRGWSTYGVEEGLPHAGTHALARDSAGTLWAATGAGLAYFDGTAFRAVPLPPAAGRAVVEIAATSQGDLWVAPRRGLLRRGTDGEWTRTPITRSVGALVVDRRECVWAATATLLWEGCGEGWRPHDLGATPLVLAVTEVGLGVGTLDALLLWEGDSGTWTRMAHPTCTRGVRALRFDAPGSFWVGTGGEGLCYFDGERWRGYGPTSSDLPWSVVSTLSVVEGGVWAALESPTSADGAVALFDGEAWRLFTPVNSGLASGRVAEILALEDEVWFATRAGVSRWSPEERIFR